MPSIAIIGGGPAGLTLARMLQVKGFNGDVTVYEREPNAEARSQGGTLDLRPDSGQRALEEAGLMGEFKKYARYEGQDDLILDKHGVVHMANIADEADTFKPEIDRPVLRRILLDSLNPGTIKWGHSLVGVALTEHSQYTLAFENGHTTTPDLVVGADGAWSRLRHLLSPAVPAYVGITLVESNIPDPKAKQPEISKIVGRGSMIALSDNKGIIAQRNSSYTRVYTSLRVPENWANTCGINFSDGTNTRRALLDLFSDWHADLRNLLVASDDSFIPRPIFALPTNHRWETRGTVTLLGDAAHVMSPFAGVGVNLAMVDGLELGLALAKFQNKIDEAVAEYESSLFPRSAKFAEESAANVDILFAHDAPEGFLKLMASYHGPPPSNNGDDGGVSGGGDGDGKKD